MSFRLQKNLKTKKANTDIPDLILGKFYGVEFI